MTQPPSVSVGIVNWNCGDYLERCLCAVQAQTLPPEQILLVDNASTDGSVERVRTQFPEVEILELSKNAGFACAQNLAIEASESTYYLPLNPDAILAPDFLEKIVSALEKHPRCGTCSGLVCFQDAEERDIIYSAGHLLVRNGFAYNRLERVAIPPGGLEQGLVGGASGVCPLYRRQMLEEIRLPDGCYDSDYFLYYEDVDLDWRARKAGWETWFEPAARAWHVAEAMGGPRRGRIRAHLAVNRWLTLLKNVDGPAALAQLPYILKFDLTWLWPKLLARPLSLLYLLPVLLPRLKRARANRRCIQARRRLSPEQMLDWMEENRQRLIAAEALAVKDGRYTRTSRHGFDKKDNG